jgi:hypothetical protein
MLNTLTLPALTLLAGLSGIPGLPWLHGMKLRRPPAPPADTLPPQWKTASRLALENQFVRAALPRIRPAPVGLKLQYDPRRMRVGVDPDSGTVSAAPELGEVPLGRGSRQPLHDYAGDLTRETFRRQWAERTATYLRSTPQARAAGGRGPGGLSFKPLPRRVQSLLGPGGPALNVSGSENIRFSGQSNWTNLQMGPLGRRPSLFPSLDMQQDLDIRLEGQLSDRIRVNLLQNSGIQIPLANRIAINYRGEEDDVVQELALGNTNLSLPGTQYVSYSGKNEGLFGIKTAMRVGPLDFTVLASKQEGKSERAAYTGGASHQTQTLADLDYLKGVYFFLYDPNLDLLDIPDQSVEIFLDDYNYSNDQNSIPGRAFVDAGLTCGAYGDKGACPDTVSVLGVFTRLVPGADQDYEILDNVYDPRFKVIRLHRPVTGNQRLAATYRAQRIGPGGERGPEFAVGGMDTLESDGVRRKLMKLLRAPVDVLRPNDAGFFDTTNVFVPTRELELKNFYQLGGQRIDPASFTLTIRKGDDDPPVTYVRSRGDSAIPYLEILGLDNFDQSRNARDRGHDGKLDGTYATSDSRQLFVDYENGTLFFFDPRPFAPRVGRNFLGTDGLVHPRYPFDQAASNALNRRDSLVGAPESSNEANPSIYDKYVVQRWVDRRYNIDVDYTAARAAGEINLGRGNLIEGSDVVTINGQPLVRDRDYTIDYDVGRVTLKKQLGPADQLNIDYSYAPLFQQAGRTLVGNAFRLEGRDKSFGGAFMYESKGAQDLRPRLGEEPSRSLIGDLNTAWAFHPEWVTRLVDRLPGVRTTAPSDLNVQAEMGASFPNPNTKNVVYIDDMEGVRDAVSVPMSMERWTWSSVPKLEIAGLERPITDTTLTPPRRKAEIHWYSPAAAVKERDLKPNLSDAQGAQTAHQVLALSIPRRPTTPPDDEFMWAGLTCQLDQVGLDLSRSQFIELWVNDFDDLARVRDRHVRLHVDLGVVSEDQMRSPDMGPNHLLDTEDQGSPPDRQLTVTERGINEDTGLDGLADPDSGRVLDLVTASPSDPQGDDFHPVPDGPAEDMDPARFRYVNGTEDNHTINPVPDTEDLNLNNILDTDEHYFEYTIDLCDTCRTYLVTDVKRDFASPTPRNPVRADNGWRRYRIPITDPLRAKFGLPDLTLARHVRVWLDSLVDPDPPSAKRPLLMLGGLEIVGSRWQLSPLTPQQNGDGTTLTLSSLNSVDNADEYRAPFDPGTDRSGGLPLARREQSLALEFENLSPDDTLEVFKTFSIFEDYSRYGSLTWWVSGVKFKDFAAISDTLRNLQYFVRFASDELGQNYYEYKAPIPLVADSTAIPWREIRLRLTELSNLKLRYAPGDLMFRSPGPEGGDTLIVRGRPSFTRLRRVSFGVVNAYRGPGRSVASGKVLFDELRATDVARDAGYAKRLQVNGRLANLLSYNLGWNTRDANFQSVGESRGGGNTTDMLNLGTSIDLHRFFEATGIVLPLNLGYTRNMSRPRFTAGDDVLRTGIFEAASETRNETRSLATSYTRQWSPRANPFLRYTIGGITSSYSRAQQKNRDPSSIGRSVSSSATVNYSIAPRLLLALPLPLTRARLYPLPERFYWNYAVSTSESQVFDRKRDGGVLLRNSLRGRTAGVVFGADTRPVEMFHHQFEAVRNLMLRDDLREKVGFINFGRVVTWRQAMDARYTLTRGPWVNPVFNWNSTYTQDNRPELSPDLSVRAIANNQAVSVNWSLPFDRLSPAARVRAPADSTRAAGRKGPFDWRGLLSRLGGMSADASFGRASSYSRLSGTPGWLYLAGLSDRPGFADGGGGKMKALFGNTSSRTASWRTAARTRLAFPFDASAMTSGDYSWRRGEFNGVVTRGTSSRFPDLDFDYGRIPVVLRIDRVLRNPRIRTAYSRSRTADYRGTGSSPTNVGTSSQWQPLLGLSGDFRNSTRAEFKVERRVTVRENFEFNRSTRTDRNTDVNLTLNRSYTRGQKVKVLGRESTVSSSIQLSLSGVYSRTSGEIVAVGAKRPQLPTNQDRLSVNGTGNYSFSSNVTGGLVLGFGQTRNLVLGSVTRNVRVEFRASLTF